MDADDAVQAAGHGAKLLVICHYFDEAARVVPHHLDALLQLRLRRLVVAGQIFNGPLPSEVVVHVIGGGVELGEGFLWWR